MRRFKSKEIKESVLALAKTPLEKILIQEMDDPVLWAENHFLDPDTGENPFVVKPMFRKVLQSPKKDRAIRSGRQLGKCEAWFTKVRISKTEEVSAEELYTKYGEGGSFDILSTHEIELKHITTTAIIYYNGIKPIIRINTLNGFSTGNTDNHPYLVYNPYTNEIYWEEAIYIKLGDYVAITNLTYDSHYIDTIIPEGADIFFDKVTDIIQHGEDVTYAITVPETENLITDNFITHNTVHLCVDILHTGHFNKNYIIPVFVPSKKNMERMMEIMNNLLRTSDLNFAFSANKKNRFNKSDRNMEAKFDHEIQCSNGSVIRFFFMNNNPDKARGQTAHGALYIDEVEYLPQKAFSVVTGILKANPNISIWASSTPSGLMDTWFREFSDNCSKDEYEDGEEFHLPTYMDEDWAQIEPRMRAIIFDDVTWKLEIEAEWATARGAVYKKEIIDGAIERGKIGDMYLTRDSVLNSLQYERANKFIGVDWNNPQNGVRIVELAEMNFSGFPLLWLTRNEIISYEEYTQTRSVERIIELYDKYRYKKISVDSGYGEFQIERITQELVKRGIDPSTVLHVVDCNSGSEEVLIEYISPVHNYLVKEPIKIRVKDRIVNLVTTYLESTMVLFKEDELDKYSIIPELRNFRIKETSVRGGYIYSDKTHSLSALQINVHGIEHYKKNNKHVEDCIEIVRDFDRSKITSLGINSIISHTTFNNNNSTRLRGLTNGRERRSIL
jgi:hypothetical protein